MNVNYGKLNKQRMVKNITIAETLIKSVNFLAKPDGNIPLKFSNKHGIEIHDDNWITGVDYDDYKMSTNIKYKTH